MFSKVLPLLGKRLRGELSDAALSQKTISTAPSYAGVATQLFLKFGSAFALVSKFLIEISPFWVQMSSTESSGVV